MGNFIFFAFEEAYREVLSTTSSNLLDISINSSANLLSIDISCKAPVGANRIINSFITDSSLLLIFSMHESNVFIASSGESNSDNTILVLGPIPAFNFLNNHYQFIIILDHLHHPFKSSSSQSIARSFLPSLASRLQAGFSSIALRKHSKGFPLWAEQ